MGRNKEGTGASRETRIPRSLQQACKPHTTSHWGELVGRRKEGLSVVLDAKGLLGRVLPVERAKHMDSKRKWLWQTKLRMSMEQSEKWGPLACQSHC